MLTVVVYKSVEQKQKEKGKKEKGIISLHQKKKYEQMVFFFWFSHNNSHVILKLFMRSIKCNYLIFILPEKKKNHEI